MPLLSWKLLRGFSAIALILTTLCFFYRPTSKTPPLTDPSLDPDCHCRELTGTTVETQSLCSLFSSLRGHGQKVISYSFYGSLKSAYFKGIRENFNGIKSYYPGYIMRLYYDRKKAMEDNPTEFSKLCDMFCSEPNFDLCDVNSIGRYPDLASLFGMIWRFAPMADPLVDEWHCRDLDSRISPREVAAVNEWVQSGKSYHIMRDNPVHTAYIVGCCFGMSLFDKNRAQMEQDFSDMLPFGNMWLKGRDQAALGFVVWPHAVQDMMAHDSYTCRTFSNPGNRPWPTQRDSGPNFTQPEDVNFVGSNGGYISLPIHGACPVECRPANHQNWLLC